MTASGPPPAIILAAGESKRMGGPLKPLLPYGDGTFLSTVIKTLRAGGCQDITVVLGCRAEEVRAAVNFASIRVALNPDWPQGMLSSLRAGVSALPDAAPGALVTLVDLPGLKPETVRALLSAWQADSTRLLVAEHNGRRGHPVIFPRDLFNELLTGNFPDGPRGLRRAHRDRELAIPVDDPGVLLDIDTPTAYHKFITPDSN